MSRHLNLSLATLALVGLLVVSGLHPYDRMTWWLEVAPILIALPIRAATHRRYSLTPLLYAVIFLHAIILMAGGAYTYARVPLGDWIRDLLDLSRNPYDKLGHFAQGFTPALVAREVLTRGRFVRTRGMLAVVVVCVVLAVSASYELIEWLVALLLGQGAEEFLGTQGDPWDTQSDMATALIGGVAALLLLARVHERQIERIEERRSRA